ncbi:MAG: UvrD-helicase domain-containing protein [Propionibacteriaceae bacterium]|nr:UvrD-helicase domain-containing protein [Propionibacteriaceae bacterium]
MFDEGFSAEDVEALFAAQMSEPPPDPEAEPPTEDGYTHDQGFSPDHGYSRDDDSPSQADRIAALVEGLNPPQEQAVLHCGSPLLVVAGAGSGKTRVLTRRIAYLISAGGVHPGAILAITFTNKAAAEMRERVGELVGNRSRYMWVATFHSACVRILRADIDKLGVSKTFSIYDDMDSKRLVSTILREKNLDTKKFPVRTVRSWISDQKNALVWADEALASSTKYPVSVYAEVYAEYRDRLIAAEALDFDDLLMSTVRLFREHSEVREKYRRRFRHVLVDEYQDTNHAQYVLIQLLCSPEGGAGHGEAPELMVVGDSDQSIYAFRGASITNILNFSEDFPGARVIQLEQNYRSTQNILSAANSLIRHNRSRPEKNLWTDAGDGPLVVGYVGDTEHDEARFIADEIRTLSAAGESRLGDAAVFYRTNAQSRAVEDVFIRLGVPYRVVGGVKFYERREVRDAIAYLRALANPADEVSIERIINVPRRGIGDTTQETVRSHARAKSITITEAIEGADTIPGLSARAVNGLARFAELMSKHREMITAGVPADEILRSILQESGYLDILKDSQDPQDETRLENLAELIAVATEFVGAAHEIDVEDGITHDDDPLDGDAGEWLGSSESNPVILRSVAGSRQESGETHDDNHVGLMGAPEPDDSLPAFLERIALVADSDQIPDGKVGEAVVTLMTLHTAKGLEFDTVFVTGFEEGLFPHERAQSSRAELEEERRLAYVGLTRARNRLYVSRSEVRTLWGNPAYNPESRFLSEIPERLIEWRRQGRVANWGASVAPTPQMRTKTAPEKLQSSIRSTSAKPKIVPDLVAGDRVIHSSFGLGTVLEAFDHSGDPRAKVDFGSYGTKILSLKHSPVEKL